MKYIGLWLISLGKTPTNADEKLVIIHDLSEFNKLIISSLPDF
ncbi:hypothetical protein AO381_0512 [Moraxella catarrhalis]|nr:hypothetical protein AO381_0512 [Moraxella catarrhalis]